MNPEDLKMAHAAQAPSSYREQYRGYTRYKRLVIVALVVILLVLVFVSIMLGTASLSPRDVLAALFGQGDEHALIVVWNLRMPRILTAIVGGIALALAGCAFQSVLRNPLASASTLGISQGAAFGASIAIIVLGVGSSSVAYEGLGASNPYLTVICAFLGAIASTIAILALSRFRDMTPESIVLAGVALSALFTGATALIQYFAEDTQVAAVVFWTFGDLGRASYREIAIMAVIAAASFVFFYCNRWNFNAMESGEGTAHGLGLNVRRTRLLGMIVGAFAASSVIAFCGTINFIGLVAPHIMRRFIGSDYRYLLVASALAGAGILLLSDIIARMALVGVVLPISAITSFVGAPLFLYLLMRGHAYSPRHRPRGQRNRLRIPWLWPDSREGERADIARVVSRHTWRQRLRQDNAALLSR